MLDRIRNDSGRWPKLNQDALALRKYAPRLYPALASLARIQGQVEIEITADNSGNVKNVKSVQVISGQPLLQSAAISAAKQWQFEPGQTHKSLRRWIFHWNAQIHSELDPRDPL